jgi:DNA phosphorothioation-dependent restriction protein DptG
MASKEVKKSRTRKRAERNYKEGYNQALKEVKEKILTLIDHYEPYRPLTETDKKIGARESLYKLLEELEEVKEDGK